MPETSPNSETAQNITVNVTPEDLGTQGQTEQTDTLDPEVMTDEEIARQDAESEQSEDSVQNDAPQAQDSVQNDAPQARDLADSTDGAPKAEEIDWKDAYRRLAADFDNYRKRTSKEQDDIRKLERKRVIGAWLEVYDNAERALQTLPEKEGPWFEGFSSLIRQMDKCLSTFNVKPVEDAGQKFDPNRHEAIAAVPNPAVENNTIIHVEQRGFVYENGDILRHAKVIVVKNPS